MLADPSDRRTRERFEDLAYTLCVLMGKRCGRELPAPTHAAARVHRTANRWCRITPRAPCGMSIGLGGAPIRGRRRLERG
ncbi:DUF5133 domain-containing protein [Streptomyces sp. NBC_01361]|uniref:DUF5133 domain-containing protein n=1 Tax=Streptomyces sp. NBC_01361 TaxID=2903838 RepID=UPI003FCC90C9